MADVSALREAVQAEARRIFEAAVEQVVAETKAACPVGETTAAAVGGTLQESVAAESSDDGVVYTAKITASALGSNGFDYAEVSDAGHGEITPNNDGGMLVFEWGGGPRSDGFYRLPRVEQTEGKHWFKEPMPERWAAAVAEASG